MRPEPSCLPSVRTGRLLAPHKCPTVPRRRGHRAGAKGLDRGASRVKARPSCRSAGRGPGEASGAPSVPRVAFKLRLPLGGRGRHAQLPAAFSHPRPSKSFPPCRPRLARLRRREAGPKPGEAARPRGRGGVQCARGSGLDCAPGDSRAGL